MNEYDGDGSSAYELEFGDGHPGQMEDLGFRKYSGKSVFSSDGVLVQNPIIRNKHPPCKTKAEEVFIIVRELAQKKGGYFRWRKFFQAALAVMQPSPYQTNSGFKCTVGSMLRAQVKHGTIVRVQRGLYRFACALPVRPLYVQAGRFNMTPEDRRDWRPQ